MDSGQRTAMAHNDVVKHKKGKPLSSGERRCILNVFNKLSEENPGLALKQIAEMTGQQTGVGTASVYRIRKQINQNNDLKSPSKTRNRCPLPDKYDDFTKSAIRSKIHQFFIRNELPTVKKILAEINGDDDLPNFSRSTLQRLLKVMKFKYVSRSGRAIIIDRDDIVLWRRKYLRSIKQLRTEGRKIYYLDETWVNAGHTVQRILIDETVTNCKKAFLSGLSTGLKNPTGKGQRLIVLHIGSEDGFVPHGKLVFASKSTKDYHEEMDGATFETWFENILPQLEPNCVIVMDNAKYHSRKVELIPNMSWTRARILEWLQTKNISYDDSQIKSELLELIPCALKSQCNAYRVDNMAAASGRQVLRIPPYHCSLNPIELVWSQVKGHVARNNKTFKFADIKELLEEGLELVTAEKWSNCVRHVVEKEEVKMWNLDRLMDDTVEAVTFRVNCSSDDDTSSESESHLSLDPFDDN